jgi:hypothetical protein
MGETAASSSSRSPLTWADRCRILGLYAAGIAGAAMFPRLAHWARWPARLGVRGGIFYAAFNALLLFASRELLRHLERRAVEWEHARDPLRQKLGREPTERELFERLGLSSDV